MIFSDLILKNKSHFVPQKIILILSFTLVIEVIPTYALMMIFYCSAKSVKVYMVLVLIRRYFRSLP